MNDNMQWAGKGFASRSLGGKGLYKSRGAELLGLSSLRSLKWKGFFYHLKLLMVLLHGGGSSITFWLLFIQQFPHFRKICLKQVNPFRVSLNFFENNCKREHPIVMHVT